MNPYNGHTPFWMFMNPPPPRRKRHNHNYSQPQTVDDIIEAHKKWGEYLEEIKKKEKEKEKKPPKQSEVAMSLIAQLSIMIVVGLPIGIGYAKLIRWMLGIN